MFLRLDRLWLQAVVFFVCCLPLAAQNWGGGVSPISPLEAVHLVERRVERLSATSVRLSWRDGVPVYVVEGRKGEDGYQARVDARVARVLRVDRNGEPYYEWPGVIAVGHRGTVQYAPENTIAAFERAIELGVDLLEMDIRETRDGHLVVIHDETVDRTTNGTGKVSDLTLAELQALDAGAWFAPRFKGEKVPTLEETLRAIRGRALPDIDFKAGTPEQLVEILRREGLLGKVTLYCGDWDLLRRTLEVSREFKIRPTIPLGRIMLPILIREFNPPIVNIDWPQFTEDLIREIHLSGREAFVNTMGANDNEFGILHAIDAGADYIQSDRLDILMPLLRARGLHR